MKNFNKYSNVFVLKSGMSTQIENTELFINENLLYFYAYKFLNNEIYFSFVINSDNLFRNYC